MQPAASRASAAPGRSTMSGPLERTPCAITSIRRNTRVRIGTEGSTAEAVEPLSPLLHRADLTKKRRRVEIRAPPLRFSIFVVDDEGHWHLHGLVRGRDACEFAALSPRHRALADHGIALRDGPLDLVVDVGQSRPQRGVEWAAAGLGSGSVAWW